MLGILFLILAVIVFALSCGIIDMSFLSMGMSGDYYEAILEGANMVRIGSALFGNRIYK